WDVERPPNPVVVIGERDEMTVRFEFGYAATNVSLRSSCVDAPRDVANEYQDKGFTDIKWS
ncbi:MAG: hypothetical protein L0H31_13550, partial [Nocardioidaceae bacterium]|nr:hypothetical protein [Nocardioidaceae bacterium]